MFHLFITYLSSTVILLSGMILLLVRVPRNGKWRHFRISRIFLTISYTVLALAGIGSILFELASGSLPDLRPLTLSVAFLQALLFTFISISFIRPDRLTVAEIAFHAVAVLPFFILSVVSFWTGPVALYVSAAAYLVLICWCICWFLKNYREGIRQLEESSDADFRVRMRWVQYVFFGAVAIGLMALVFSVLEVDLVFYDLFVILHTAFYVYTVGRMCHYLRSGNLLADLVASRSPEIKELPAAPATVIEEIGEPAVNLNPSRLDAAINRWVEEEGYLVPNATIDDIADSLKATHDELNEWCTSHYGLLFRTWRMQLRIGKAKQILTEAPDIKISELQTLTGFSDKSHFFKQFKQIVGMTPSEYRKKSL